MSKTEPPSERPTNPEPDVLVRSNSAAAFRLSCYRESLRYAVEIGNLSSQAQYAELLLEFSPNRKEAVKVLASLREPAEWEVYLDELWVPATSEQLRLLPNFPYRLNKPPTSE